VPAVARGVFGATDPKAEAYTRGIEWGNFTFSFYSITCFAVAFALPWLAKKTTRKTVHACALVCGSVGLLSTFLIGNKYLLIGSMIGVGIAWASILSMPYAILSGSLPAARMGVYMGIFNFFIVIPEITQALTFGCSIRRLFGENNPNSPLYMVVFGGICLLLAALLVTRVQDVASPKEAQIVLEADKAESLLMPESSQPVPSTGVIEDQPPRTSAPVG